VAAALAAAVTVAAVIMVQVSAAVAVAFAAVVHAEAVLAVVQGLTVPVRDLDHTTITVRGHITIMEVRACHHLHHREEDIMEAEQLTYIQTAVAFVTIIMLMLVLIVFSFYMQFKGGYTGDTLSDNRISEYAEDQYNTIFSGREDGLLLVVDENDNGQFKYGVKANALMDTYINSMISAYQNNYNDDLGIQLKGMLEDTLEIMKRDGISKIKSDKAFDSHCYRDDLNWIDTKNNVVTGAQEFYDATGIQFYVMFVKTRTIAKATNHSAGVFKVLIIAAAVVIVVCILFSWWKKRTAQKNKEQEDLERTLKTPLETFGSTPMDDLKAKYDNQDNNQS